MLQKMGRLPLLFLVLLVVFSCIYAGNYVVYILFYIFSFVIITVKNVIKNGDWVSRIYLLFILAAVMVIQLVFAVLVIFDPEQSEIQYFIGKILGTAFIFIPFIIEPYLVVKKELIHDLPVAGSPGILSYSELKKNGTKLGEALENLKALKHRLGPEDIAGIIEDLPRHSSFQYVNRNSLPEEYFLRAEESLSDDGIYIVLSDTGSAASELISLFTHKIFNHVSLSFDSELETIISYNGGERVYEPGLNPETIEWFNKKPGASILVYRLDAPPEKKRLLIEKVRTINREGSAYNLLGLILKLSMKPNINFCSQFVYRLLEHGDLNYFRKPDGQVKPTDLVELDYRRKLRFLYELKFSPEPVKA